MKEQVDKKLEMRRKHFHVLIASLNQLQATLVEENENSIVDAHTDDISDEEMDSTIKPENTSEMIID